MTQILDQESGDDPVYGEFVKGKTGVVYHMMDNGQYSGSLFFIGMDGGILRDDAETKMFEEMLAADNTQGSWAGYHRMLARNIRKSDYK